MKLSKVAIQALQVMTLLTDVGPNHLLTRQEAASRLGIPLVAAMVVLRRLARRGVIRGVRGRTGGYCLALPPDQTTLLDIVAAADWPLVQPVRLPDGPRVDPAMRLLEQTCQRAVDAIRSQLAARTLMQIVADRPASESRAA